MCLVTFAIIGGAYYYFIFAPKQKELKKVKNQYNKKLNQLTKYKKNAAQLEKYEKMMADVQKEFVEATRALPNSSEIPALLTSISKAGTDSGLEFKLFKPLKIEISETITQK